MSLAVLVGDCGFTLATLPANSVHACVTSPPYFGLRNYGVPGQVGQEDTPEAFVARLVAIFHEVRRVLRDDGTLWLNLGDSYAANQSYQVPSTKGGAKHSPAQGALGASTVPNGLKPKDLIGIPWRVAFALQSDGWYLRQDIIWHKPNPMPESVKDRCTKAHEYIFMLSKSAKYYYDAAAIREPAKDVSVARMERANTGTHAPGQPPRSGVAGPRDKQRGHGRRHAGFNDRWNGMTKEEQQALGANKRDVWTVATYPYFGAHFATFPPDLIRPCILAGAPVGGTVLDPFGGSGTTGMVALQEGRSAILCELNPAYVDLIHQRCGNTALFEELS
jgi:DNA modification methylase